MKLLYTLLAVTAGVAVARASGDESKKAGDDAAGQGTPGEQEAGSSRGRTDLQQANPPQAQPDPRGPGNLVMLTSRGRAEFPKVHNRIYQVAGEPPFRVHRTGPAEGPGLWRTEFVRHALPSEIHKV